MKCNPDVKQRPLVAESFACVSCRTALMLAAEAGAASLTEVLVQRGADPYAVDSQGHGVGHYANMSGNQEVRGQLAAVLSRLQQVPGTECTLTYTHSCVKKNLG